MNRRTLLTSLGTAGVTALAGCTGDEDDSADSLAAPAWISVWNNTGAAVDVAVEAAKDGAEVYADFVSLDGAESRPDDDVIDRETRWIDEDWLGEATDYEVAAELSDTEISDSISTAELVTDHYDGYDPSGACYYFLVRVGPSTPRASATPDEITATIRFVSDEMDIPADVDCD